jgi:hypothetical protein
MSNSFLILAHPSDTTSIRVASLLRRRHGVAAVHLKSADEIALAPRWRHGIDASGARTELGLHDGFNIAGDMPAILNRLSYVDPAQFANAPEADREYARMEMFALMLSWLASTALRVVCRPTASSLAGCAYRPVVWRRMAQRAGFATLRSFATTSTRNSPAPAGCQPRDDFGWAGATVSDFALRANRFGWHAELPNGRIRSTFVVGNRLVGVAEAAMRDACRNLAAAAGADLLRVDYCNDREGRAVFVGADPFPDVADEATVAALAALLEHAAAKPTTETLQ